MQQESLTNLTSPQPQSPGRGGVCIQKPIVSGVRPYIPKPQTRRSLPNALESMIDEELAANPRREHLAVCFVA